MYIYIYIYIYRYLHINRPLRRLPWRSIRCGVWAASLLGRGPRRAPGCIYLRQREPDRAAGSAREVMSPERKLMANDTRITFRLHGIVEMTRASETNQQSRNADRPAAAAGGEQLASASVRGEAWDAFAAAPPKRPSGQVQVRKGEVIIAEQVREGWIKAAGGRHESWCPITDPGGDEVWLERRASAPTEPSVPPGWEILRLQEFKIHQRGVQWTQGVVVHIML